VARALAGGGSGGLSDDQLPDSACDIAHQVRSGTRSAVDIVRAALARVGRLEPRLHAWVTVDAEGAVAAALELDARVSAGVPVGPLAGVPVGVKDIIDVRGLPTTACSPLFTDRIAAHDADCVAALRAADAIILGKTVCSQLGGNDPPSTVNPWNASHTPGGSSSGSAVAVAVGMCPVALGSQTGGSTLRPAAYNGIVGLKPSYGRVSLAGMLPFAPSLDTIGVLSQSVADAWLVVDALLQFGRAARTDVAERDNQSSASGPPTLGVVRQFFFDSAVPEVCDLVDSIVNRLVSAGARVRDITLPGSLAEHERTRAAVSGAELAATHAEQFAREPGSFAPFIARQIELGLEVSPVGYLQAQRLRAEFSRQARAMTAECDVLLMPTTPDVAPADLTTTGSPAFQAMWTSAGLPSISIPVGLSRAGLPVGIQLVAAPMRDRALTATASWCADVIDFHSRLRLA
jgi:Asp-tRNA(Asn)/Glu-tRNA(Gln) amidotransferase A subunit family amidase